MSWSSDSSDNSGPSPAKRSRKARATAKSTKLSKKSTPTQQHHDQSQASTSFKQQSSPRSSPKITSSIIDDLAADRQATAASILDFEFLKQRVNVLRPNVSEVKAKTNGILYWMSRDCRVHDNWALLYAQKLALKNRVPLHVGYCLHGAIFPVDIATLRQYGFLLDGVREVSEECARLNVQFHLLKDVSDPIRAVQGLVHSEDIGCVVCDFWPLRGPRQLLDDAVERLPAGVAMCQVDAHNIVPVWETSPKLEYAARTIRNKVNGKLDVYLQPFPPVIRHPHGKATPPKVDWDKTLASIECDRSVKEVKWITPGYTAAVRELAAFCQKRLRLFNTKRNDPTVDALSNLAPWLRHGQLSAQRCVLMVRQFKRQYPESVAAYCEEVIVRRELSENFCYYNAEYDSMKGLSDWARSTLMAHKKDKREWIYTLNQLEQAHTHDDLWNAAQLQLVGEGKMHGFLRMYWSKKILEWTTGPEVALAYAIHLNDKYSLDGYSPNGFVGCMWSIGGIHDMGWKEREIFGKIRYMNYAGCRRKFDVNAFVARYGGKVYGKQKVEHFFLTDPELHDAVPLSYLSHKELYEASIRKATIIFRKIRELQMEGKDGVDNYLALLGGMLGSGVLNEGNPLSVHFVMFLPTIMGQGTSEQQAEWMGRAWNLEIMGTYAQTELGHGTFIRGLETRATYDPATKEFVMNSPTITAYKWWPGGLGHSANYAVVVAQLYSKGKNHGIHPFIVQLRDEDTWQPMPGINIGEIGPKLGMKAVNNGFLGFDNVRIPRKNMLMRNAQVLEDGTFVKSPASVLTYGTMMFVRVVIIRDMANYLSKAVTIATRYSAVRRQSPIDPSKPEPQVIDHVTQQNKLFPNIARSIIFKLTADYIWEMYNQVTSELNEGNLERLPELHALSCCLKAVCTSDAAKGVEVVRMACGGHGYMESSNLPNTYGMVTAACTYEGENTVMLLQTARYLVKSWGQALKGATLVPTVSYLRNAITKKNQQKPKWDPSIPGIITSLQFVAANKVRLAYEHIENRKGLGYGPEDAANATSIELVDAAEAHCRAFLVQSSYEMIKNLGQTASTALTTVIQQLIELYAIETCTRSLSDLLRFTGMIDADVQELQLRLENVLSKIRPNAVGMVDGFDIPDQVLNSTLGAYDGNVYERLFAEAQKSPLNQEPVNMSFEKYLKPFMKSNL